MKQLSMLCLALLLTAMAFAQSAIRGRVVDAQTGLPLEGASVFAQNTTAGTVTNKEGVFALQLGKGGYELIVTYTGYNSSQLNVEGNSTDSLLIPLRQEDKSLSEVVITASNEVADGWEKHGDFFLDYFIGSTPFADSCFILNPEVLKFYYYKRSDKLKVLATEPLQIANRALGYRLQYTLDSFVFYNKTAVNAYRGLCLYQQMEGDTALQQLWAGNRKLAYYGSRLHFLRSYFDSTLLQEGFTVDLLSATDNKKFNRLTRPYDTAYYSTSDTTEDVELWFPVRASITYNKQKPDPSYLQQYGLPADVKVQISYVDLAEAIIIKPNGFFLDQRSWLNAGYWSWKNLADLLPYDYEPE